MADEVGDRRRGRVTENTSRLRLDFLFRANNVEESGPFCSQTQLKIHMGAQASSRMMLRAHLWRAASGRGQVSAEEIRWRCPPRADPRDPAVTLQQLPLRSSLWNLQHSAAQSAPNFGVRLSNCHMADGL